MPTIADVTYKNYDGPIQSHALRWWVVALATLRQVFGRQKIAFWIIAAIIGIVYLINGALFFFSKLAQDNMGTNILGADNMYATVLFNAQSAISFWLFVAALTVGASSIAADNRANALLVYLAKPITKADYLIGKWVGVFLVVWSLVLVPNLLLYLFLFGTYWNDGFLAEALPLFGKMLLCSLITPAVQASMILAFSASSRSPRIAGAIYAAAFLIIEFILTTGTFVFALRDPDNEKPAPVALLRHAHIGGVGPGISMNVYGITPQQLLRAGPDRLGNRRNRPLTEKQQRRRMRNEENLMRLLDRPPLLPVALLAAAYILLPILVVIRRIRAVEVIKG